MRAFRVGLALTAFAGAVDAMRLPWFVKTETFKASLSFPEIRPHLEAHKVWVAGLREDGMSISSGYRVDSEGKPGGGGLMLFTAEDYAAAEKIVRCDPLIANDCVDWTLNEWVADVGDIALVDGGAWYRKRRASAPARAPPPTLNASPAPPTPPPTVLEPDYRLAAGLTGGAGLLTFGLPLGGPLVGAPLGALGLFLAARTASVRFVFDESALEIMAASDDGGARESGRENFAVGGRNRWAYDAITEWGMYPSAEAPVLVYFRESQTRPEGQGHLFPVLCSPQQLRLQLDARVGAAQRTTAPPQL